MPPVIRAGTLADIPGYHACLGAVALERRYIGFVAPPALEKSNVWVRSLLDAGNLFLVVCDDSNVVGWCDAGRIDRDGFRHRAELGMGLLPQFRRMGIGSRMLEQAISWAQNRELEILELSVYASNASARRLYARFGFAVEGLRTRARKLDDLYDDIILMALHLQTPATPRAG